MQNGLLDPLKRAMKSFLFEVDVKTAGGPHIRDGVDLKRWMMLVVYALFPCMVMAVWNTGVQAVVFQEGLYDAYVVASKSFRGYFSFCAPHVGRIVALGLKAFLPILIISYGVGGFWEVLFACVRRHEVSEGFLVTGMLYALILPSTIPYWMAAVGISVGVVLGKELFGGTGMNILNPALVARCFLFFTFPQNMTGEVWVGTNTYEVSQSIERASDGATQQSALNFFNISTDIKRIHVDTIAGKTEERFASPEAMKAYVIGELALPAQLYPNAVAFSKLRYGEENLTDGNFFWGNMIGSMGETSFFACLLGAAILLGVGIASWRIMVAMALGAIVTALAFWLFAQSSLWTPAKFDFPIYKHLLLGSFAFGLVFMATEPVTAPKQGRAKWAYGFLIGLVVIVIRVVNPAFPEGVMLAILFGNVFSPLFDHYALKGQSKRRRRRHEKILG